MGRVANLRCRCADAGAAGRETEIGAAQVRLHVDEARRGDGKGNGEVEA